MFEWVPLAHLFIDERYQRPPSRQVKKIVEEFDPRMIGSLLGSRRSAKKVALIDGQHRFLALRQLGVEYAPALVISRLKLPAEARLFARLQSERLNVRPVQRFRAELAGELERAVEIDEVLGELELTLTETSGRSAPPRSLGAVKALEDLWAYEGQDHVRRILELIVLAWNGESSSLTSEIIRGVDYFVTREDPDDDRLVERLGSVTPADLLHRASALRTGRGMGGKSPGYMAEAIRVIYRKRASR